MNVEFMTLSRVLRETVKDFATKLLEANIQMGDQILCEKCRILEHEMDQLLQMINDHVPANNDQDREERMLESATYPSTGDFEKGSLEKPEKDMTNLSRVRKCQNSFEQDMILSKANSLKRAIRQVVEHAEVFIDEQKNAFIKATNRRPSMTVISEDNSPTTKMVNDYLDSKCIQSDSMFLIPTPVSSESSDVSPCVSPMPNLVSLSPMPDLRRDSQAEEMLTLPAPDGFADSRRNSSNQG